MESSDYDFSQFETPETLREARVDEQVEKKAKIKKAQTRVEEGPTQEVLAKYKKYFFDSNNNELPDNKKPTLRTHSRGPSIQEILKAMNIRQRNRSRPECIADIMDRYGIRTEPHDPPPVKEQVPEGKSSERTQKEELAKKYGRLVGADFSDSALNSLTEAQLEALLKNLRAKAANSEEKLEEITVATTGKAAEFLSDLVVSGGFCADKFSPLIEPYMGLSFEGLGDDYAAIKPDLQKCFEDVLIEDPELLKHFTAKRRLGYTLLRVALINAGKNKLKKKEQVPSTDTPSGA